MQLDNRIKNVWLRLLSEADGTRTLRVENIEEGYYAVVLATGEKVASEAVGELGDYQFLESFIPNLSRTRAVYLNSADVYKLPGIPHLHDWAGALATRVEQGSRHAFGVVDPKVFAERVKEELLAAGWTVERADQDLRVEDGRFAEQVNLLRTIVLMVFWRSNLQEAARGVREEISRRFALDAALFRRCATRFAKYAPAVLDHYFTASTGASRLTPGWDYWEVSGRPLAEAERLFDEAMQDFELFLAQSSDGSVATFPTDVCA
jgi:hypothetical protein